MCLILTHPLLHYKIVLLFIVGTGFSFLFGLFDLFFYLCFNYEDIRSWYELSKQ